LSCSCACSGPHWTPCMSVISITSTAHLTIPTSAKFLPSTTVTHCGCLASAAQQIARCFRPTPACRTRSRVPRSVGLDHLSPMRSMSATPGASRAGTFGQVSSTPPQLWIAAVLRHRAQQRGPFDPICSLICPMGVSLTTVCSTSTTRGAEQRTLFSAFGQQLIV
jgi:hypothetical protein